MNEEGPSVVAFGGPAEGFMLRSGSGQKGANPETPSAGPVFAPTCWGSRPGGLQVCPLTCLMTETQQDPNTGLGLDCSACYTNMILLCTGP